MADLLNRQQRLAYASAQQLKAVRRYADAAKVLLTQPMSDVPLPLRKRLGLMRDAIRQAMPAVDQHWRHGKPGERLVRQIWPLALTHLDNIGQGGGTGKHVRSPAVRFASMATIRMGFPDWSATAVSYLVTSRRR